MNIYNHTQSRIHRDDILQLYPFYYYSTYLSSRCMRSRHVAYHVGAWSSLASCPASRTLTPQREPYCNSPSISTPNSPSSNHIKADAATISAYSYFQGEEPTHSRRCTTNVSPAIPTPVSFPLLSLTALTALPPPTHCPR